MSILFKTSLYRSAAGPFPHSAIQHSKDRRFQRPALTAPRGEEVTSLAKRIRQIVFIRLLNTRMVIALDFEFVFATVIEPHTYLAITTLAIVHSNTAKII